MAINSELANFVLSQCMCGRGMVLTLVLALATFVLVRSEDCGYEYNPDTGYMDYWCSGSHDNFESYIADVASYEATSPPPPAYPTNHCRGGSPFLGNQFCQIRGRGGKWGLGS